MAIQFYFDKQIVGGATLDYKTVLSKLLAIFKNRQFVSNSFVLYEY